MLVYFPAALEYLVDAVNTTSVALPASGTWDDSTGTIYVDNNNGTKRAISWTPQGYSISTDGSVADNDRYPLIIADPPHDAAGKTIYYVSTSDGDDGNDGLSTGAPLYSVGAVNDLLLVGGDEVQFKRGDTWNNTNGGFDETLNPERDGDSDNFIKFTCYGDSGDALPLFDGEQVRDVAFQTWKNYQWVDQLDFYNCDEPPLGMVRQYTASDGLHISNCKIRTSNGTGIYCEGDATHIISCYVADHYEWGVYVTGATTGPRDRIVAYNEITDCAEAPDGATGTEPLSGIKGDDICCGNYIHNNNSSDHHIYRGWNANEYDGAIGLCRIHDNIIDGSSGTASSAGAIASKGRGGRVFRNRIIKGGTQYGMGISAAIASATDGGTPNNKTYVHHNEVFELPASGENGCLTATTSTLQDASGTIDMWNWNNTCDQAHKGLVITDNNMGNGTSNSFYARNNLIQDMQTQNGRIETAVTLDIDNNYYYGGPVSDPFYIVGSGNRTFEEWQSAGHDANGIDDGGDPLFDDDDNAVLASRSYTLDASSPARLVGDGGDAMTTDDDVPLAATDTATFIGINYVPHGTTPDLGAHQYLNGNTLDFAKKFLGLDFASDTAATFRLKATADNEETLNAWTGA